MRTTAQVEANLRWAKAGQDAAAELKRSKTECRNGHPYNATNTYERPDGSRGCRVCRRLANQRRWRRKSDQERQRARKKLAYAIAKGRVIRPDECERCGEKASVQGHHSDYARALEVQWLCSGCHGKAHAAELVQLPAVGVDEAALVCGVSVA